MNWRFDWIENRMRHVEAAEDMTYGIPRKDSLSLFFFSPTGSQIHTYNQLKIKCNNSQKNRHLHHRQSFPIQIGFREEFSFCFPDRILYTAATEKVNRYRATTARRLKQEEDQSEDDIKSLKEKLKRIESHYNQQHDDLVQRLASNQKVLASSLNSILERLEKEQ